MTDELEELRMVFRSETPVAPREEARRAAIGAAMEAFDKKKLEAHQGTPAPARLMHRVRGLLAWSTKMQSLRLSHALMAGASLAAITLVVVNSGTLRQWQTRMEAVERPAVSPKHKSVEQEVRAAKESDDAQLQTAPSPGASGQTVERQVVVEAARPRADRSARTEVAEAPALQALVQPAPQPSRQLGYAAQQRMSGIQNVPLADEAASHYRDQGRDRFKDIATNPVKIVKDEPVSTFSVDVDTASYSFVRNALNQNVLPQKDAVRVEEMINYFPYDYAGPADRAEPFKANVSVFPTPWNADTRLMHIGIKGFSLAGSEKPKANLVFLVDTSGSMDSPDKLPLLRNALKMLVETLAPDDTVSIVAYAGSAGTVLEPTKVRDKAKIVASLDRLMAGGSTAGAEGIRLAYQLAEQSFDPTGINRVILATDGDFNVGITDTEELKSFVERKRETGVSLSVLGFGMGNYNDELMQTLAQNGNGNAAYIDTLNEARKVLVEEATSTLFTIAKDVKIQVEFNPQTVSEYRLIGYETRMLNREDFNNDKVDAGDIGSGHTVTTIYELTPKGSGARLNDDLRYGTAEQPAAAASDELAFVKIRYKLPDGAESKLITQPVKAGEAAASVEAAPREARFASAVAAFGQLLRGGQYTRAYAYDDVIGLAQTAKGDDPFGYRAEFINLARIAKTAQALEPQRQ